MNDNVKYFVKAHPILSEAHQIRKTFRKLGVHSWYTPEYVNSKTSKAKELLFVFKSLCNKEL
jgi:hypothetical protein